MATSREKLESLVRLRKSGEGIRTDTGMYISIVKPTKETKNLMSKMGSTLCNIQNKTYTYFVPFVALDVVEEVLNEDEGERMEDTISGSGCGDMT